MKAAALKTVLAAVLIAASAASVWGLWPLSSSPALDDFNRYVFVPSLQSSKVSVIDSKTDTVAATLDVGVIPGQVVVSEAEAKLVASDVVGKKLAIVDLLTRKRLAALPLEITPDHMQLSPDGYLLAVGDIAAGKVAIVSLHQGRTLSIIGGLAQPYNLTFSSDASLIYVANKTARHVSVISSSLGKVVYEIPVTDGRSGETGFQGVTNVTRTPNGRFGFATVDGGDFVNILNMDTHKSVSILQLDKKPWRAYGTADGRMMLVPNNGSRTVSVIDTSALKIVATLPGAADVVAVNTGWFDSVAFVVSRSERKAVILDLMRWKVVGDIALPGEPDAGVVTPDGRKLYVALNSGKVAVIDTRERRLTAVIDGLSEGLWGITMGHSNNYCH
jgi:YVTN family beta-propeller protein